MKNKTWKIEFPKWVNGKITTSRFAHEMGIPLYVAMEIGKFYHLIEAMDSWYKNKYGESLKDIVCKEELKKMSESLPREYKKPTKEESCPTCMEMKLDGLYKALMGYNYCPQCGKEWK